MSDGLLTITIGLLGLSTIVIAWFVFRAYPRLLMAVWAAVLFFVPVWIGVQAGVYLSALVIMSILGIATASLDGLRWSILDLLFTVFVLLLVVAVLSGGSTVGHLTTVLVDWMIPYIWGRVVVTRVDANWVYGTLAAAAVMIAFLAIVEFVTGNNIFVGLAVQNPVYRAWSGLQYRGGNLRVEASFGHSIALGSSIAMASVFVAVSRWPAWVRLASLVVLTVAAGMTFSRLGIIGIAITLILAIVLLGRWITRGVRIAMAVLLAVVAAIGVPLVGGVFGAAGSEATGSAEYRSDLFALLSNFSLLGITPSWKVLPTGETYYGSFQSIDNALLLTGLRFGFLPFVVLVFALLIALLSAVRGRATPASVAIIGQFPAFVSVALITQYAGFVWFSAGLAVASYSLNRVSASADSDDGEADRLTMERAGTA